MSTLTVNNSLLDYEGRTRSQLKNIRNYQRVSQSNLDDTSIIVFLKSRNLTKTLSVFLSQTQYMRNINPLIDTYLRGAKVYTGDIHQYWRKIKQAILKNKRYNNQRGNNQKILKLQLYIRIWYCILGNQLNADRIVGLKKFYEEKGQILSQVPSLLKYFVLPYVDKNLDHPIIKKIFSAQWRDQVRQLLQQLIGGQNNTMQRQWFNIINDMIEICDELVKNIGVDLDGNNSLKGMIERVKLYKSVIQSNEDYKKDIDSRQNDMSDMKSMKKQIQNYNRQLLNGRDMNIRIRLKQLYIRIQQQLYIRYKSNIDKQFILELIDTDILLLKDDYRCMMIQQQWLRLLQSMCSYYRSRIYIQQNIQIIDKIINNIQNLYRDQNNLLRQRYLYISIDILQKIMVRRQIFQVIINNHSIYSIIIMLFNKYSHHFQKGKQSFILYQVILSFILNTVMHKKGCRIIVKNNILPILISILERIPNQSNYILIQQIICSIIYLLLVEESVRQLAVKSRLKEILLNRLIKQDSEEFGKVVQYIIERMENEVQQQQIESDKDVERQCEYDQKLINNSIFEQKVYNGQQNVKQQRRERKESKKQKSREVRQSYSQQKYDWKKKWLKK